MPDETGERGNIVKVKAVLQKTGSAHTSSGIAWRVDTEWDAPVDRPSTHAFSLANKRTAERLVTAINAQAVFVNPRVLTDSQGQTYVAADSRVLGKYANADLTRLGF